MQQLPEIPAQDFFLGLASAGLLLAALLVLARPRARHGRELGAAGLRKATLFTRIPLDRPTNPISFLGALFLHLVLLALVPWMELMFPGALPFDLHRYDLVLVQFKKKEAPLTIPPDIARLLKRQSESQKDNPMAIPDLFDDPGRGDGEDAPKLQREPGGEATAERPKRQEPKLEQEPQPEQAKKPDAPRFEIVLPERPSPKARALAEVAPAPEVALQLPVQPPGRTQTDLAWEFEAPDPDALPFPGVPALADLKVESPALLVTAGLPTNMPDLGQDRLMTPPLAELADAPSLGELGENGYGSLLAQSGPGVNAMLLGAALRGGAFGDFYGGSAGNGAGAGFGDGEGPGASGQGQGKGFGIGRGGRSPVPRKLHGIILISNDASTIPEAADVLTGNPIYTVYLEVPGFTRKWILQVCVPAGDNASEVQPGVIRVLSHKSLDPPYAERKSPLELALGGLDPRYLPPRVVVYATVSPDGELGNMRIVSGLNAETDNQILANLQEWEFNPAFRDGEPVAVEALFGIPLR
jgi:hypothetical protein